MAQRTEDNPPFGWKFNSKVVEDITELYSLSTAPSYTVYTALITQSSTGAPVATILENTTGLSFPFSRDTVGKYYIHPTAPYDVDKTTCVFYPNTIGGIDTIASQVNTNDILFESYKAGVLNDDRLVRAYVEIRVYN